MELEVRNCTDLKFWIVLNETRGKLCSFQTVGNLFVLELGLQSKSPCIVTLFPKDNVNIWH